MELNFRANLGVVQVTVTDSEGNTVDEKNVDTGVERLTNLDLPDSQKSYVVKIEGDRYMGEGTIE